MTRGPHPVPKRLKLAPGRPSARPVGAIQPTPTADLPQFAEWLPESALPVFGKLVRKLEIMGYASDSHAEMLNVLAFELHHMAELAVILREMDQSGAEAARIRSGIISAAKHAHHLAAEFGLTPASSTRIAVPERGAGNQFAKFRPKGVA